MAVFVLIHGMFHGGWCWKKVTPLLRRSGYEVYLVTLTGVGERVHLHYPDIDMHTHIQDVVNVLEYEDLDQVILVGHSLAGFMAPAVAERVPRRIAHIVNLDGVIPLDGKPFKEMLPEYWEFFRQQAQASGDDMWASPVLDWTFGLKGEDLERMQSKLTPHPLKTWETPLYFTNPAARSIPRTYILCTDGDSPEEIIEQEQECSRYGWRFQILPTGHDGMISAPKELADMLLGIVDQ